MVAVAVLMDVFREFVQLTASFGKDGWWVSGFERFSWIWPFVGIWRYNNFVSFSTLKLINKYSMFIRSNKSHN